MSSPTPNIRIGPAEDVMPVAVGSAPSANVDIPETCSGIYNAENTVRNISIVTKAGNTHVYPVFPGYNPIVITRVNVTGSTFGPTPNIWVTLAGYTP